MTLQPGHFVFIMSLGLEKQEKNHICLLVSQIDKLGVTHYDVGQWYVFGRKGPYMLQYSEVTARGYFSAFMIENIFWFSLAFFPVFNFHFYCCLFIL